MNDDVNITGFGLQAEGEAVSYEPVQRTPEEVIEYLKEQLRQARVDQNRYRRVKSLARNQMLMVANKNGFTLVEDMDEYLKGNASPGPLTRKEILREAQDQLEDAFRQGYKAAP